MLSETFLWWLQTISGIATCHSFAFCHAAQALGQLLHFLALPRLHASTAQLARAQHRCEKLCKKNCSCANLFRTTPLIPNHWMSTLVFLIRRIYQLFRESEARHMPERDPKWETTQAPNDPPTTRALCGISQVNVPREWSAWDFSLGGRLLWRLSSNAGRAPVKDIGSERNHEDDLHSE